MSRTLFSGSTGKPLSFPSGNWECIILGRVAALMKTKHYIVNKTARWHIMKTDRENKRPRKPWWYFVDQPYQLDGPACREFANALINVTDKVVAKIHPHTHTFIGTPAELKEAIVWQGKRYAKLKQGYTSA
jgi:hypothetical protein